MASLKASGDTHSKPPITVRSDRSSSEISEPVACIAKGVEIVAVSLGADGSLAVGNEGIFRALVPRINAVNTVGCGDSMIAGFALGLSRGLSLPETMKLASAISAAAAMREETGFFVMEDMEKLLPQIEVTEL